MLDDIKLVNGSPSLFEAFGLGALLTIYSLWDFLAFFVFDGEGNDIGKAVTMFADYSLLVAAAFVFFAYVIGRMAIAVGGSSHRIISRAWDQEITPYHRYAAALNSPDRIWIEYQRKQRELSFFEGLIGSMFFMVIFQIVNAALAKELRSLFFLLIILPLTGSFYINAQRTVQRLDILLDFDATFKVENEQRQTKP